MIRTQVYIPEDLRSELFLVAKREKKTLAEIVRQILAEGVERKKSKKPGTQHPLEALAKLKITGGPKDLSVKIDKYLYGGK